jgi:hypothetical protein
MREQQQLHDQRIHDTDRDHEVGAEHSGSGRHHFDSLDRHFHERYRRGECGGCGGVRGDLQVDRRA